MSAPFGHPTVPPSRKTRWKYCSSFKGSKTLQRLEDRSVEPRPEVNGLLGSVVERQTDAVIASILCLDDLKKH
jgi:hypothetical protein